MEIVAYPRKKYLADLKAEVQEKGLRGAVHERLEEIELICRRAVGLGEYQEIVDLLNEIEDLMEVGNGRDAVPRVRGEKRVGSAV